MEEGEMEGEIMMEGFQFIVENAKRQEDNEQILVKRRRKQKFIQKLKSQKQKLAVKNNVPLLEIEYFPLSQLLFLNGEGENPYPMLIKVTKKSFLEASLFKNQLTPEQIQEIKSIPKKVRRFYLKREFLFSQFQKGIMLDEESWYSVIPECISKYIAERLFKRIEQTNLKMDDVIDPFCGSGGLAIQLAKQFAPNVKAFDIDEMYIEQQQLFNSKVKNLRHNMQLYEVEFQVERQDFFELQTHSKQQTLLFLCPPWQQTIFFKTIDRGGIDYLRKEHFDLITDMTPSFYDILKKADGISQNFCIQLPRNIKIKQLISIFQETLSNDNRRFSLEIELIYINEQINMIFVYYGDISSINYSQEIDSLYKVFNLDGLKEQKGSLKTKIREEGIKSIFQSLKVEDQVTCQVEPLQEQSQAPKKIQKKRIRKAKTQQQVWSLEGQLKKNIILSLKYDDI